MSHCTICDRFLTEQEAKRKHNITKQEIGLCDTCLRVLDEVAYLPAEGVYNPFMEEEQEPYTEADYYFDSYADGS